MNTRAKANIRPEACERPTRTITARQAPQRMCLVCHQRHHQSMLVRLVCDPTGQVIIDIGGKLPGRGAYVCPQRTCAMRVVTGKRLQEALRREIVPSSPDELVQAMAKKLEERGLASIRIARKAGRIVSGYSRVVHALQYEPVALLLVAENSAPDRLREYTAWCEMRRIPYRSLLTKAYLGELVGRDECSAIGIQETRMAERMTFYLEGVRRLMER